MDRLTDKQIEVVEEAIWLANAARASRPGKYGEVDLSDPKEWEQAFLPKTVQQRALRRYLDGLRPKYKVILQAVMALGTGLRERDDFPHLVARFSTDYKDAGRYLCSKDQLGQKLLNGLKKLGIDTNAEVS